LIDFLHKTERTERPVGDLAYHGHIGEALNSERPRNGMLHLFFATKDHKELKGAWRTGRMSAKWPARAAAA